MCDYQVELLDTRRLLLHSEVKSRCHELESSHFYIILLYAECRTRIGFKYVCDVTNVDRRPRLLKSGWFSTSSEKIHKEECENSPLV